MTGEETSKPDGVAGFNSALGQLGKDAGMALAAENNREVLEQARHIARILCLVQGEITADDVGREMSRKHGITTMGPTAGSIFRSGDFYWTGKRRMSTRISNHRRELKVWALKPTLSG
jgi:hypothetical protein